MKNNFIIRKHGIFALMLTATCLSAATPGKTAQASMVQEAATEVTSDAQATTNEETLQAVPEAEPMIVYSTADDLNLREKASTESKSLKKLDAGDSMTILTEEGKWYKVQSGKKTGYVNKLYVSTEWIAFSNTVNLNLRKENSTSSEVIDQLNQGDAMTVLEKDGKWYKVEYSGKTGYVKKDFIDFQYNVYVDGSKVNMRKSAHTESNILKTLNTGATVTLLEQEGAWYKVRSGKKTGYIHSEYISFTKPIVETVSTASSTTSGSTSSSGASSTKSSANKTSSGSSGSSSNSSSSSSLGQSIVNYAKKFLGNPYVYGGTSLTNGADCSGFVQSVYAHFGISLPRTSTAQRSAGYSVGSLSKAKPGDLICYYGHVGIYIGDNAIIHASNEKSGIKITYNAAYRKIAAIRRVI